MGAAFVPLKRYAPIGTLRKLAQPGQGSVHSGTQVGDDLVDYAIQFVRRLGLADAGPASHPFGNIRLLHPLLM
ncbi:MAG: hypothetical protein ABSB88_18535 [Bryobacteraceae bacterium]|jgi:hypothetical protein